MNIFTSKRMTGLTPDQQCSRALEHILLKIRDVPYLGWHLCLGTESYALLTEAFASVCGADLGEVRKAYLCKTAEDLDRGACHGIPTAVEESEVADRLFEKLAAAEDSGLRLTREDVWEVIKEPMQALERENAELRRAVTGVSK